MQKKILLSVNIDHVATIRQVRGTQYPEPVYAALIAEEAGADGITLHLREDARHIQKHDVINIKSLMQTKLNLELKATDTMVSFAMDVKPYTVCFVPESSVERSTTGGLDLKSQEKVLLSSISKLHEVGIKVSLFIKPTVEDVELAYNLKPDFLELNTEDYTHAYNTPEEDYAFLKLKNAATAATQLGMKVNAGHGLHYNNVQKVRTIKEIHELSIGHAIVARALFTGFKRAVIDMKALLGG